MGPKSACAVIAALVAVTLPVAMGQSNYDKQAISITYEEEEAGVLPIHGTVNGTETNYNDLPSTIVLNRTKAELNCSAGFMGVKMLFDRPFYGIVYADFDRNSACKITGSGSTTESIMLPLKGCGTVQSPVRVFTNNIVVRFHPNFEIVGDEVITIICRYPPPIVPAPALPAPLVLPPVEEVRTLAPLREFEILLIICAIIFLALLLLGMGCSYYCLKKRNIKVVKRRPASTLGSEVTKISEPFSMFGGLKIPRAHAEDSSGSEELTESVRSDFQSEIISTASEEDFTSCYSDGPFELPEGTVFAQLHAPPRPGFDVKTKVSKADGIMSDVESTATSESEMVLKAQEQYLTTILERTETNTLETLERVRRAEAQAGPPPVHARVRVVRPAGVSDNSELESESEYSQVSDYYQGKLKLPTAEQTNFTLGLDEVKRAQADRRARDEIYESARLQEAGRRDEMYEHAQFDESTRRDDIYQRSEYDETRRDEVYERSDFESRRRDEIYASETVQENIGRSYRTEAERVVGGQDVIRPIIVERATANMRVSPARNNFDVLIRVLDEPENYADGGDVDDASSVLTEEERFRLKEVIMTDERIQTILKETHTTEKMLMLKDYRQIGQVIHPQKWDVLIRIIDNADKRSMSAIDDTKSSVSASTYGGRHAVSSTNAQEVRSMSEVMVDYGYAEASGHQMDARSGYSGRSSTYTRGVSSIADRSGTEIMDSSHFINKEAYFQSEEVFREDRH